MNKHTDRQPVEEKDKPNYKPFKLHLKTDFVSHPGLQMHKGRQTDRRTNTLIDINTYIYIVWLTDKSIYMYRKTNSDRHTYIHTYIHTYRYSNIYAYIYIYI